METTISDVQLNAGLSQLILINRLNLEWISSEVWNIKNLCHLNRRIDWLAGLVFKEKQYYWQNIQDIFVYCGYTYGQCWCDALLWMGTGMGETFVYCSIITFHVLTCDEVVIINSWEVIVQGWIWMVSWDKWKKDGLQFQVI